jgi:tetratricopeptide (TPR) repeat protein
VVAEFHRVRKFDRPPVFVIQGVRGSQKSELLDHLRFTFSKRAAWHLAEDKEAKVDFWALDPEPESTFASIARQLTAERSWVRPLRFPRLKRLQEILAVEQQRAGSAPPQASAVDDERNWLATTGGGIINLAAETSIPTPPRSAAAMRKLRVAWWRVSPTRAGRWTRRLHRSLPHPLESPDSRRRRMEVLEDGLAQAAVEDLRRATRRFLLPVSEVALFVDGYHRVERSAQPDFVVEFAKRLAESEARVILVIACREQTLWSKLAESQADYKSYGTMEVSERVQIHHLQPLAWADRIRSLYKDGVPPTLAPKLAEISLGMPVMLDLLGAAFGDRPRASRRSRELLAELPEADRVDEAWFEEFSRTIASDLLKGLPDRLELHLRAAATQRNFDKNLLERVIGDNFSEKCYRELVQSELVGTPRPSLLLDEHETYRVRSFVRSALTADPSEEAATQRWHRRAATYFERRAEGSTDPDLRFRLEAEALFHRLFTAPLEAKPELFKRFQGYLLASRTDHCEALLRVALDFDHSDSHWRATVLAHAGKMYLARNRHPLAEERLLEAKRLVSLDETEKWLAVTIHLSLAKCYRLQERFADARRELGALSSHAEIHPVVEFQRTWSESLEAKDEGRLQASRELAEQCEHLLEVLLEPSREEDSARAAEAFGLAPLPRKRFHIARHFSDLARRSGYYALGFDHLDAAVAGYRDDPEDGIVEHAELGRAHLLRGEGVFKASLDLAEQLYQTFTSPALEDLRGAAEAGRCIAHAQLCGVDPEQARAMLEELVETDPQLYPRAPRFGLFGLGELERLQGNLSSARRLYQRSQELSGPAHFECCYGKLGTIELDRIERPHQVTGSLRQLLRQPGVSDHPSVRFYAALIKLRAFGLNLEEMQDAWVTAERFTHSPLGRRWEAEELKCNLAAIEVGEEPPPLIFNLP